MSNVLQKTACPVCSTTGFGTSLAVYENGAHCFECGHNEFVDDVTSTQRLLDNNKMLSATNNNNNNSIKQAQKSKQSLPLIPAGEHKAIKSWGISKDSCKKYNYTWTEYRGDRVQCLNLMKEGRIVAQKIRTADKDFRWFGEKDKAPVLMGMDVWEPNDKLQVVCCEGEKDLLAMDTINESKWPVVSLLNGAGKQAVSDIAKAKEYLDGFKSVVFMFDGDDAGRTAAEQCSQLFSVGKAKVARMPDSEDICSLHIAGKDELVKELMWKAVSYKPKDIVSISDYTREELYSKEAVGIPMPYPLLSHMIRGLKPGRLYTFCAASGLGKSTIVKELAYHLMFNQNIKVGSIFLEQDDKEAMRDYIAMHCNIEAESFSENPERADKANREYAESVIAQNGLFYKHFGSLTTKTLISKIEYLMVAGECDFVILDHISMVTSGLDGTNERKDIDILMTELRSLIQRTKKSIIGVVHLKRGDKNFNEGGKVSLTDLRGSASLEQISDFVVAIERDQHGEQSTISKIKVLKSRRGGKVGYTDELEYNYSTGRLLVAAQGYNK